MRPCRDAQYNDKPLLTIDTSTLFRNIASNKSILINIYIANGIDKDILKNLDGNISKEILENIGIDIDEDTVGTKSDLLLVVIRF